MPVRWTARLLPRQDQVLPEGLGTTDWVRAAAATLATFALAVLVRRLVRRALQGGDSDPSAGRVAARFASLVVVAVGLVYVLVSLGARIGPLLGALGVGGIALAFALQDILQNFVAGLLLQLRRPFHRGDQVSLGDYEGVVRDVNLRTVELLTYDGLVVYLPNAQVLRDPIVNYTRTPLSRTELSVGVTYDTDLPRARAVLVAALAEIEGAAEVPAPEVWAKEFADSSIVFAVRYWHGSDIATRWRVRSEVAMSVKHSLDAAGITIPFPQRTVWYAGPAGPDSP